MIGDPNKASAFGKSLFDNGVFGMVISFPTVPKGKDRIRVMNSATHSTKDLDFAVDVFVKVGKELGGNLLSRIFIFRSGPALGSTGH